MISSSVLFFPDENGLGSYSSAWVSSNAEIFLESESENEMQISLSVFERRRSVDRPLSLRVRPAQ